MREIKLAKIIGQLLLIFSVVALQSGCASVGKAWKSLVGGSPKEAAVPTAQAPQRNRGMKFSQNNDVPYDENGKQYRRMTRDMFEDQARVEEKAGSLWVMEGQGSYLFSQNTTRLMGDAINIRLEGEPKRTLEAKADVIKKLIKKTKKEEKRAIAAAAEAKVADDAKKAAEGEDKAEGKAKDAKTAAGAKAEDKDDEKDDSESAFQVVNVPSRILERMPDGNYRVRGSQSFMIGKFEYRVIVVGVAKPSDISDETVDSSRMLDSKFDIVSIRKEIK